MTSKYEAFVLAAETGSFKSTAEQLGYTQAGISYMMSSLESEMGTALFARDHSGVRLTEDGRNLLPWIQDVCTSERALQARLGEVRHLESGTVRVAAFASTAIRWLPGIVDEFTNAHPKVELEFACFEDQRTIEEGVLHGEFDCGFIVLPPQEKFFVIPLVQDPIYVALAPHHPLAQEDFSLARRLQASRTSKFETQATPNSTPYSIGMRLCRARASSWITTSQLWAW